MLGTVGVASAVLIYFVAQKFKVDEDPRIDMVTDVLPLANCGGCGFPGCRNFAENLVKADDISSFSCPAGGNALMMNIAQILGKEVDSKDPFVAVVRCNGSLVHRPQTNIYDGALSCAIVNALYKGDTDCRYGCLCCGDCVVSCKFNAMIMDPNTDLPVIDDTKCTGCGACVKACPRNIIELRKKDKKNRKIFVSCVNKDKGGIAKKYCAVACTGCAKCLKVCTYDAIRMENNLAYIDFNACKMCRKCSSECSTNAIHELNFPTKKLKQNENEASTVKPSTKIET
jgi:Na+-translocating ferredoxin:NAD+ oxidoreductase RNF subunit RnfB